MPWICHRKQNPYLVSFLIWDNTYLQSTGCSDLISQRFVQVFKFGEDSLLIY